jgi:hypothetical protein
MAVRRKLDLAGIKLKLQHWSELDEAERAQAKELPRPAEETWQQATLLPEVLAASCAQLGLELRSGGWGELTELQRFALVKLSHPGQEHRNLPRALAEFMLLV